MKLYLKEKLSKQVQESVIVNAFYIAAMWLYGNISHGIFGRFFSSFDKTESVFEQGLIGRAVTARPGKRTVLRSLRRSAAGSFERSGVLAWFGRLGNYLLGANLKMYATFIMVFGFYTVAMTLLRAATGGGQADVDGIIVGAIAVLVSIPMFAGRMSLAAALREGVITRFLLIKVIAIPEAKLNTSYSPENQRYSTALVAGMFFGVLTYFIDPLALLLGLAVTAVVWVVMNLPEAGLMTLIATAPFMSALKHPSAVLAAGVLVTTFAYLVKYLRGKRTMRMGIIGLFVSIFSIVLLFGGIVSAGGGRSFEQALLYFVLIQGFCLTVNLIRTRDACRHAFTVLTVSAVIAVIYGMGQYMFGFALSGWIDTEMFAYIAGRATSFFDNPNVFATYLVMLFPALTVMLFSLKRFNGRFLGLFAFISALICLIWTWSRGAWLAFIVGMTVFFLIFSYKTLAFLFAGCLALPFAGLMMPGDIVDRFLSIGSMADSSTYYRVYTWRGVSRMIGEVWPSGIGVGTAAFEQTYPLFAYAGMESAPHAHNLILQLIGEVGIAGFAVFAVAILLFAQCCISFIRRTSGQDRIAVAAGFAGIVAVLTMGLADNIWYNYRVFFIFWVIVALTVSFINAVRSEADCVHEDNDANSSEVGIIID